MNFRHAHQCWLCGEPGRAAADDGCGWSWVPADGGAWHHCDGCAVSWAAEASAVS